MKIAFLTPEYPHAKTGSSGGIGTSIKNLSVGLIQQDCSVRVFVYAQNEEEEFEDNGIIVQRIKNVKFKGLSWYLTRKKLERIINKLYEEKQIDIVEAPDWTGITSFVKPKKCPIVIRLNGSDTYFCHLDKRPVKWNNKFHERRALKKADALLSVSKFTADKTNEVLGLQQKYTIIPNGIDTGSFQGEGIISEANKVLYFGSLIRKKGLLELPLIFNEVIKQSPDCQLILVGKDVPDITSGNSSTWKMMQDLFSYEARSNVQYLGSAPYEDVRKYIVDASVCIFPSFAEALPVSWIEAMAMQKAIVTSNIGWAPEVIDDGINGFLVNPKNHKEYANKILTLLGDKALQKNFGTEARNKVINKFSMEVIAKQSLSFYKTLIQ